MASAIISGKSKKDIHLLMTIAEKMGVTAKLLTKEDMKDLGLAKAIIEGKTGEFVDTNEFLKSLK
jgi:hypothetical protein